MGPGRKGETCDNLHVSSALARARGLGPRSDRRDAGGRARPDLRSTVRRFEPRPTGWRLYRLPFGYPCHGAACPRARQLALALRRRSGGVVGLGLAGWPSWCLPRRYLDAGHSACRGECLPLVLVIAGNLIGAAIYDHFGAFGLVPRPFTALRLGGLTLVLIGVLVTTRA